MYVINLKIYPKPSVASTFALVHPLIFFQFINISTLHSNISLNGMNLNIILNLAINYVFDLDEKLKFTEKLMRKKNCISTLQ